MTKTNSCLQTATSKPLVQNTATGCEAWDKHQLVNKSLESDFCLCIIFFLFSVTTKKPTV